MNRIKNELSAWVNRGVDRHLRLAVTGLSRSGKTAFITSLVNQLLGANTGARLPLFSVAREGRLLGVKRVAQRDLGLQRFTYDQGLAQLYGSPPAWPVATRGVSEMRLALRYRPANGLLRHLKDISTLYLEIVDYPGEWLLDLPMLDQDYFSWSRQMTGMIQGDRHQWSAEWRSRCAGLDPFAPADESQLAAIAESWTEYLRTCKNEGLHFIQPGRFVLPGDLAGAPVLQFFPWPGIETLGESKLAQADPSTNFGMLRARFNYYCEKIVKGFYKEHFVRFDRQIVLVDCLQPLNSGPQAFNDMRLALSQLMQSFHYGQRTLYRRLFSPVIDKLLFAATKADHVTHDQHENLVSLLSQLVLEARQHVAFEGVNMNCMGIASVQATQSGLVTVDGEQIPALRGERLSDGAPLTVYPGDVPPRLPGAEFWQQQQFQFEQFRPRVMSFDSPLPHIRMDAALDFLIGDKLQ
ncbi:YcjX family protein [Citrobacter sp. JGM124]|uniref:YcjX family protein n=1 Tax=Citrobacter sp. JGM124 TaxID=2799789 RepID=UPI001BA863B7|nr:YcjX family protein [Citrobacter sp. JGM124]MBS0847252.1 YcjX family protein [Citrobacter sp. JGM124]